VEIADGAYVAAGSTITSDVEIGQLAVSRGRQRNVSGWGARKRAGTKTARAAEAALQQQAAAARPAEERREDQGTQDRTDGGPKA
jgi:bifunctional UDP-N-acetylglucosamine pyrophosphorylase/glucosamine-1-phosphate N-acetyltransferase